MEGTDLKNGATEPTKATDPRSTAQNSTRRRPYGRLEGERDLTGHTSSQRQTWLCDP
jgi:hypothetical protein